MAQRKPIAGRQTCLLYSFILTALILVVAGIALVLIVRPELESRRQAAARLAEAERHYQAGVAFQNAGDCTKATESFTQVISLEPGYRDAQRRLAEARACQRAAEATATAQALAMARAAAEIQATATANARTSARIAAATATAEAAAAMEAAYQRGLGYYNLERWADAKTAFEEVFAMAPTYKDVQAKLKEIEARLAEARARTPTVPPSPTAALVSPTATRGPTPTALPTTPTPEPGLPFFDDFDAGPKPDWEVLSGTWGMVGGKYTLTDISGSPVIGISVVGDTGWRDYTVEADVSGLGHGWWEGSGDDSMAAILIRVQDDGRAVGLLIDRDFLDFEILEGDSWTVVPGTRVDGYGEAGAHIKVEVKGNVYTAYVDGKRITSFSDDRFPSGKVGLWLKSWTLDASDWRAVPKIDNFKVTKLD